MMMMISWPNQFDSWVLIWKGWKQHRLLFWNFLLVLFVRLLSISLINWLTTRGLLEVMMMILTSSSSSSSSLLPLLSSLSCHRLPHHHKWSRADRWSRLKRVTNMLIIIIILIAIIIITINIMITIKSSGWWFDPDWALSQIWLGGPAVGQPACLQLMA